MSSYSTTWKRSFSVWVVVHKFVLDDPRMRCLLVVGGMLIVEHVWVWGWCLGGFPMVVWWGLDKFACLCRARNMMVVFGGSRLGKSCMGFLWNVPLTMGVMAIWRLTSIQCSKVYGWGVATRGGAFFALYDFILFYFWLVIGRDKLWVR